MKSVPIIEYDGYPHYTNTRVEVVTTEAEVRCEIINLPSVPTSPTPLSSPDKSVGDCSKDDQKDHSKTFISPLVEEVAREEEKKPNNFEERLSR